VIRNLADLEGAVYGPVAWKVDLGSVQDFAELTGDDLTRSPKAAPPGFSAAAIFTVAPKLLADLYGRSVIHGEQTFTWVRPVSIEATLDVEGRVTKVRERAGVWFVTFEFAVEDAEGDVVSGKSLFLVSGSTLAAGDQAVEAVEPHHSDRGDPGAGQMAASRADLVRYASATRDWNPVHWDHDAGVAAGFPGVVVHGMLQAGWAVKAAAGHIGDISPDRFSSARFRFRHPLRPAHPVSITVEVRDGTTQVNLADGNFEYMTATIVTSDE